MTQTTGQTKKRKQEHRALLKTMPQTKSDERLVKPSRIVRLMNRALARSGEKGLDLPQEFLRLARRYEALNLIPKGDHVMFQLKCRAGTRQCAYRAGVVTAKK